VGSVTISRTGVRAHGQTAAIEDGQAWSVPYVITLDEAWHTRHAQVWSLSATGERNVIVEIDGAGRWRVNGHLRPDLDVCLDVDLESISHRPPPRPGQGATGQGRWVHGPPRAPSSA
jgi:hypothetical protein